MNPIAVYSGSTVLYWSAVIISVGLLAALFMSCSVQRNATASHRKGGCRKVPAFVASVRAVSAVPTRIYSVFLTYASYLTLLILWLMKVKDLHNSKICHTFAA